MLTFLHHLWCIAIHLSWCYFFIYHLPIFIMPQLNLCLIKINSTMKDLLGNHLSLSREGNRIWGCWINVKVTFVFFPLSYIKLSFYIKKTDYIMTSIYCFAHTMQWWNFCWRLTMIKSYMYVPWLWLWYSFKLIRPLTRKAPSHYNISDTMLPTCISIIRYAVLIFTLCALIVVFSYW